MIREDATPTPEQLEARKRWVELLREGKYTKGLGRLITDSELTERCCLGVACDPEVIGVELDIVILDGEITVGGSNAFLPWAAAEVLGIPSVPSVYIGNGLALLSHLNDETTATGEDEFTHSQIADMIEYSYITPFRKADQ